MINFKRIIYDIVVAVALASALAAAAPAGGGGGGGAAGGGGGGAERPCRAEHERHYDQRQNGTENYRLNIDGVVIAVAPADSLLAAASEIDFGDLLDLEDFNEIQSKPKPPTTSDPAAPAAAAAPAADAPAAAAAPKAAAAHGMTGKTHKKKGLKLRLAHLLMPLLKKNRHH